MESLRTGGGLPDYAELYCLSNFSFLEGASRAEELVERAVRLGYSALAITDECSLAGIVRAHAEAKKHGLKLLVGASFRLVNVRYCLLIATDQLILMLVPLGFRCSLPG